MPNYLFRTTMAMICSGRESTQFADEDMDERLGHILETELSNDRDHVYLMAIKHHVGSRNDSGIRHMGKDDDGMQAMRYEREHREQQLTITTTREEQGQPDPGEHPSAGKDHPTDDGSASGSTNRQDKVTRKAKPARRIKLELYKEP